MPWVFGRMFVGGNVIWATDFREQPATTSERVGGRKAGTTVRTTEYAYSASIAVAICEGPSTGIGRIWADGKKLDLTGVTLRWYPGSEAQPPDPLIAARMGSCAAPANRGMAYVVFDELELGAFGNRLPQLSFEVFRPLADPDTAEGLTRAVCMIPASGEFTYLRARGQITQTQYLAACILRSMAEPGQRTDAVAREITTRQSGGVVDRVHAGRIDARRRLMRLLNRVPDQALVATVLQYKLITQIAESRRQQRRMRDELMHALDLVAEALTEWRTAIGCPVEAPSADLRRPFETTLNPRRRPLKV